MLETWQIFWVCLGKWKASNRSVPRLYTYGTVASKTKWIRVAKSFGPKWCHNEPQILDTKFCVWCLPSWLWSYFGPIFPWCPPISSLQNWKCLLCHSILKGWNFWISRWLRVKILLWVSEENLDFIVLGLLRLWWFLKFVWMYFIWWVSYEPIGAQGWVLWFEHVPYMLICFHTWSLVIGTVWGCCGTIYTEEDLFGRHRNVEYTLTL